MDQVVALAYCTYFPHIQHVQGGPKKWGDGLMATILSNLNQLKNFTGTFLGKFVIKWILKIPPHLAYVATLCETLMSAKQAVNGKLHGSVARPTYLRCVGVVNNKIRKGLLLSLPVNFFKSVNIWQSYKQER